MKELLVVALERNERTATVQMMVFETMYLVLSEQELDRLQPNLELDPCWED
jgi:hypothetical protein